MRRLTIALTGIALLLLAACGPTFNWRETSIAPTSLVALFPCKPQKVSRRIQLGGAAAEVEMTGCDAAGVTLAVGHAMLSDPKLLGEALKQWREATLGGIRAQSSGVSAARVPGSVDIPQSVRVQATGTRPDGEAISLQGTWFARGNEVYAALLYGKALPGDVADTFFSGLAFR